MLGDLSENVLSTLRLLDACRKSSSLKKFIFLSSGGTVYGNPCQLPIDEDHPTNPHCSYGIHKLAIEKYLLLYSHLFGLNVMIIRAANPYGPRQNPLGVQGVIPVFLMKALHDQPLEIWGDGTIIRDFLHVQDLVKALQLAMNYSGEKQVFNVGAGNGISINGLVDMMEWILNKKLVVTYHVPEIVDVSSNVLDISRIQSELGWNPTIELFQGLTELFKTWSPK